MSTSQTSPRRTRPSTAALTRFRRHAGVTAGAVTGVLALGLAATAHADPTPAGAAQASAAGTAPVQQAAKRLDVTTTSPLIAELAGTRAAADAAVSGGVDPAAAAATPAVPAAAAAAAAAPQPAAAAPAPAAPAPAAAPAPVPAPAPTTSSPVPGARLTAHFGDGGSNWGGGTHTGLDFAAPSGTKVRAVAAGTVVSAGWNGPYGQRVVVKHADGTSSTYNHLQGIAVWGGKVAVGQTVGYLGSTGNSTGPHLHLEILTSGGKFVDPLSWLRGKGVAV